MFQVWFSNRRARLRKQAQSCPPTAYNPMGLPMSYHASSTPYMDSFSTSAAAAAAQAAQAAQAAADQVAISLILHFGRNVFGIFFKLTFV
jgi:hypothetical protein